jgi:hypothetical protein
MNYNAIISVLVHKGIMTFEEGESLAHSLVTSMIDTNFKAAHQNVEHLLEVARKDAGIAETEVAKEVTQVKNTIAKNKKA